MKIYRVTEVTWSRVTSGQCLITPPACVTGSMKRSSVRLSVPSIDGSTGGFVAERPAGRRYRSTAAGAGAAYQLSIDIAVSRRPRSTATAGSVMPRTEGRGLPRTCLYRRRLVLPVPVCCTSTSRRCRQRTRRRSPWTSSRRRSASEVRRPTTSSTLSPLTRSSSSRGVSSGL